MVRFIHFIGWGILAWFGGVSLLFGLMKLELKLKGKPPKLSSEDRNFGALFILIVIIAVGAILL